MTFAAFPTHWHRDSSEYCTFQLQHTYRHQTLVTAIMLPCLPLDVFISIMNSLPAFRSSYDVGPRTLSACLQVNSLVREAASLPSIWKRHYLVRYEHSNEDEEQARCALFQNNWRLMYQERRRVDRLALKELDRLILIKQDRQRMIESIVDGFMDVWDALELETQQPIPWAFDPQHSPGSSFNVPEHSLTRRYWAKCLLDTISRGWAIEKWQALASPSNSQTNASSFEESMRTLSCFFGASPKRITVEFEKLASECRLYMSSNKVIIDPQSPDFRLVGVCKEICIFMSCSGFGRSVDDQFYFNILNNFPHAYLSTNKRTLPISLVHIFVAICSRLGVQASPINFPGTVLAHVMPMDPTEDVIYINPSAPDEDVVVTMSSSVITRFNTTPQTMAQYLSPCDGLPMLVRASRNILGMSVSRADHSPYVDHSAILVPLCTHMIFTSDRRTVASLLDIFKFDPPDIIFLQRYVLPLLMGGLEQLLGDYCRTVMQQEKEAELKVLSRKGVPHVKYFVGMPFHHVKFGYLGVITGWDVGQFGIAICAEWMAKMQVDTLACGRHQPFYHTVADDGTERYLAEDNIRPATFTAQDAQAMYSHTRQIALHFGDIQLPPDPEKGIDDPEGRGRFIPNPHTRQTYPHDEAVAKRWIAQGLFSDPHAKKEQLKDA